MITKLLQLDPVPYPKALVTSGKPGERVWYEALYEGMALREQFIPRIKAVADKIIDNESRYKAVEAEVGTPWFLIGAIHNLEASFDFKAVLHNGERIVGTNRKTKLVPRGRGPFASWESAAIDALKIDDLDRAKDYAWTLGEMLQAAERYNGLGYLKYHPQQLSPYVWACSDKCMLRGKYSSDGRYNANEPTTGQVGVATVFKYLESQKHIEFPTRIITA